MANTPRTRMFRKIIGTTTVVGLVILSSSVSAAAAQPKVPEDDSKAKYRPARSDERIGNEDDGELVLSIPATGEHAKRLKQKEKEVAADRSGQEPASLSTAAQVTVAASAAVSKTLSHRYFAQGMQIWCGPASIKMAVSTSFFPGNADLLTQSDLASWGGASQVPSGNGIAWYTGVNSYSVPTTYGAHTGRPMEDVLNYNLRRLYYIQVSMPSSSSAGFAAANTQYQGALTWSIDRGAPVVLNVWEAAGGVHLTGHPDITIFHYTTGVGYQGSGSQTVLVDPASSVWSGVPTSAYPVSSTNVSKMLGGRGYYY